MANSLFPNFVRIFYSSPFAPHVMTLPTREIDDSDADPLNWTLDAWDASTVNLVDMIEAFIAKLGHALPVGATISSYLVYRMDAPDAEPLIIYGADATTAGDAGDDGETKAIQVTLSALDTEGQKAKLTLLDVSHQEFDPIVGLLAVPADEKDLFVEWVNTINAWASRNGARPSLFRRRTATLNEKLRRAYRMT